MPKATAKIKDLYLGKCLADLHTLSDVTHIDSSSDVIVRSLKKIFDEAEKSEEQGDEERAYVLYMRYFNTLSKVKNKADYKSKKDYFDKLIGVGNQLAAIERAEQLSESLKERYDFKQAEAVAKKFSSLDSPGKLNDKSPIIGKPAVSAKKELNAGWNPKTVIAGITCQDLNVRLSGAGTNMIILDIRPCSDFAKSHLPLSHCINVPEDILLPGCSVSDIQTALPKENQDFCLKLQCADHIVLVDWRSRAGQAVDKIPLQVLVTALSKPDSGIKTQPVILDGGFEQWLVFQASATTGQIRTENLCDLLRDNSKSVLLMDVRPRADYLQSHISHTHCISVPEDILTPGSTVSHIQSKLPDESREFWMRRKEFSYIILLDWSSTLDMLAVGSPLRTLKDALFKFDPNPPIKSEPQVLQGGYAQWLLLYPALTTNPHVAKPGDKNHQKQPSPTMLLEFDYPDFDEKTDSKTPAEVNQPSDVTPQESLSSSDNSLYSAIFDKVPQPQVNRSLKPSRPITGSPASTMSPDIRTGLNQEVLAGSVLGVSDKNHDPILSGISGAATKVTTNGPVILDGMSSQTNNKSIKQKLVINSVKPPTIGDNQEPNLQQTNGVSPGVNVEQRTREVEKSLRDLEQMRRKEQKDVADLMRLKRKLEMELANLRQEGQSQQQAAEQAQRILAAEQALAEEEKKKRLEAEERARRLEEVERLRLERKREEHLKELQSEEERKKEEIEDKTIQNYTEENKLIESMQAIKEEEERFKKEEEIKKKEESDRVLKQQILEQQKREAVEAQRRQKEQEALMIQLAEERRIQEERHRQKLLFEKEQERQKQEMEERLKIEALAREQAQKEKEAAEKINQLKIAGQEASKLVPSNQLPSGWEKRLDRATNRYFYIDHNHGTTQWTSPAESFKSSIHSDIYKAQLKSEPTVSSSRGLSRSHSSPNIKKLFEEEQEPPMPSVDRSKKPVISSVHPLPRQTAHPIKKRDLNPVFGNVAEGLTGLKNLGNTCYMNSTIQCLNNTAQLASYFVNDNYLSDINRDSAQGMHGEVVEDFAIVVKALWSQQYRSIMPRDLKNTVGKYNPMFAGYQQQDSQEFLTFLLDGLHEGLNEIRKAPDIPEQNNENLADEVAANQAWQYHTMLHKSIIVHLFQGQLKSTLTCKTCGKTSVTFQAFMFLSLPIKDNSRCSLQDCLQEFLKPELMTGSSRWKCPRCKVDRDTLKKIDIFKLPPILLIGLNRFYSEGMWTQKKSNYVDFPLDDLDMSPFMAGPKNRNKYSLYGVSNHYGTMEGGHYTAVCRNPSTKKWYLFDDQDVSEIAQSQVKTSAAYVLYYTSMNVYKPAFKPQL